MHQPATAAHNGRRASEHPSDGELRHELARAYADLGGAAFALAELGGVCDQRLRSRIEQIRELQERKSRAIRSRRLSLT
jgi:hypothetical protein